MINSVEAFQKAILTGIPSELPPKKNYDMKVSHAPKRKAILSSEEKKLALKNALRYFEPKHHSTLIPEFLNELNQYGRIYMHRFRPDYEINARPIHEYPHRSAQAAAIMVMLMNNLDPKVAQHPHELITYGGNGSVFQNWAQYLLTLRYLAEMTDEQTLVLYSGHPLGLFPSHREAPRVVITNGMMIPNYSKPDDWEKFNALGVTQYGQMTAGSFMYIGPQGIVHGMSGAQAKAAVISGAVGIIAEVNPQAVEKRFQQGWVDEVYTDLAALKERLEKARAAQEAVSIAYQGNIVDLWEYFVKERVFVDIGSDQTSLHNPWSGGYYPVGYSFEQAQEMIAKAPAEFRAAVEESLRRQVRAINEMSARGMYFFDYGNAFLLESSRAGADILKADGGFRYRSYVQDILGPMCFDLGFGPFRWVCTSGSKKDLETTDALAAQVLEKILKDAPSEIHLQLQDNLNWIRSAQENQLVVGSQARILYADSQGRIEISKAINEAIRHGKISAPVVLGRDHHDVSGTDSPYRETSNIYDGSSFTADMAVHNFVGDSFRGATWVSLHNGGGVGWGEVINGGFGLVLDGSVEADRRLESMLFWDVNNGIARRSWARNPEAIFAIQRAMKVDSRLRVTLPYIVDDQLL
ncbi:urocanate hydratase [bacterium]|nr:urocanate hydratase [bacterium]